MDPRSRVLSYGAAAAAVVAGIACAVLIDGIAGEALLLGLGGLGAGAVLLLVFYEIGMSEEREVAREEQARAGRNGGSSSTARSASPGAPSRVPPRRRPGHRSRSADRRP